MDQQKQSYDKTELYALCVAVKALIAMQDYQKCANLIFDAMGKYPHAPEPHNLLGVLLEREGDHPKAMKHFRAAWALDPTYIPVRQNLICYGTFFSHGKCAYDESDCPAEEKLDNYNIESDAHGIGRMARRV